MGGHVSSGTADQPVDDTRDSHNVRHFSHSGQSEAQLALQNAVQFSGCYCKASSPSQIPREVSSKITEEVTAFYGDLSGDSLVVRDTEHLQSKRHRRTSMRAAAQILETMSDAKSDANSDANSDGKPDAESCFSDNGSEVSPREFGKVPFVPLSHTPKRFLLNKIIYTKRDECYKDRSKITGASVPYSDTTEFKYDADEPPEEQEEHPVCKALPNRSGICFVESKLLDTFHLPWPRNQEVVASYGSSASLRPSEQDLVVAVSHMWFYERHPDPFGDEAAICSQLIKQAEVIKGSEGKTLVFYDFLSMTQPPFRPNQAPRTKEQEKAFKSALKAMRMIYLYADIVLLLDSKGKRNDKSGGHFGRATSTPARERGWIYLERFIAMVKVAMTRGPEQGFDPAPVVFSNSVSLLKEILQEGEKLRLAAKVGNDALKWALNRHLEELDKKTFSATSVDKQTNTGGVAGGTCKASDKEVVAKIMSNVIDKLLQHWEAIVEGDLFTYKNLVNSRINKAWERVRVAIILKRFTGSHRSPPSSPPMPSSKVPENNSADLSTASVEEVDFEHYEATCDATNDDAACYALVPPGHGSGICWKISLF